MRTTQPQGSAAIDTGNSIAAGLVFAMQGGTGLAELVLGGQTTSQGSNFAVVAFPTDKAFDLRNLSAAGIINVPGSTNGTNALASDESVVFDMVLNGAPVGAVPAIGGIWRSTAQNDVLLVLERATADSLRVSTRSAGTQVNRDFAVGASSLYGTRITVGISVSRGTTGRSVSLTLASGGSILHSSSQAYSASGSTDATMLGTEYISVGSEPVENSTRNANCLIYAQYHFSRVVSSSEVASLSENPWQLFQEDAPAGTNVTPGAGALTLTGYAPTVQRSAHQSASPAAGNIAVTGYAPAVSQSVAVGMTPVAASLAVVGFAPLVSQSAALGLTPAPGALTVTGFAPSVVRGAVQSASPSAAGLVLTGYPPAITQAANLAPKVFSATIMRAATTNRRADLQAALNLSTALPTAGQNGATIMRARPVAAVAALGPTSINRAVSFQ